MNKYQELLERPEWKEKRERILERDGHTCQFCGSTEQLQVHHFNYDAPTPWDVPDKYTRIITSYHLVFVNVTNIYPIVDGKDSPLNDSKSKDSMSTETMPC